MAAEARQINGGQVCIYLVVSVRYGLGNDMAENLLLKQLSVTVGPDSI